jgi:hypothetical protein
MVPSFKASLADWGALERVRAGAVEVFFQEGRVVED